MGSHKLILDMDTGIDDALALAYLATFSDAELLGVIGTYGNVAADTAVRNTAYVLELLELHDVPVMRGSQAPSWAAAFIPDAGCAQFHGTDGLGGFGPSADWHMPGSMSDSPKTDAYGHRQECRMTDPPETDVHAIRSLISVGGYDVHDPHANPAVDSFSLSFASDQCETHDDSRNRTTATADVRYSPALPAGVQFIIDTVRRYGNDVTVVATGPLTDIDAALQAAPDIAGKLRLVMMGGTLTQPGNCWDAVAETNIIQDPEAANRVFHSGADITMVGLDVTHQCLLPQSAADRWRATGTKRGRFLADLADFSIKANLEADPALFSGGMPLHDPLAAAVALDSSLVDCFDLALRAETNTGDFNGVRGRTTGDPVGLVNHSMPHVHVALGVDSGRFLDEFVERMAEVCR